MDKPDDIMRYFKSAVTDSETCVRFDRESKPGVSNLMQIYACCAGQTLPQVEETFAGSLPAFLAAFTSRKPLSLGEVDEIQKLIDAYREGK